VYFNMSAEMQIILAICIFYLYDAALGLQADEGLLRRARKSWHAQLATQGFELHRAYLLWPPVLLPHQPVYRLRWNPARIQLPAGPQAMQELARHAASFTPFALPLYLLALLLFAALPIAFFVLYSEAAQLVALALIYLNTLWLALLCMRHGRQGHTDAKTARSIAIQILLCPPFALNAVRKLSQAYAPACDLPQAAQQLVAHSHWQALAQAMHATIEEQMAELQDSGHADDAQRLRLQAASRQLAPHLPAIETDES
jgi:hypothetical protein